MKQLSLNDPAPFDLHPAGCRRLAIEHKCRGLAYLSAQRALLEAFLTSPKLILIIIIIL
jgi:hypothetical protein